MGDALPPPISVCGPRDGGGLPRWEADVTIGGDMFVEKCGQLGSTRPHRGLDGQDGAVPCDQCPPTVGPSQHRLAALPTRGQRMLVVSKQADSLVVDVQTTAVNLEVVSPPHMPWIGGVADC